jgi:hypothetical protein
VLSIRFKGEVPGELARASLVTHNIVVKGEAGFHDIKVWKLADSMI